MCTKRLVLLVSAMGVVITLVLMIQVCRLHETQSGKVLDSHEVAIVRQVIRRGLPTHVDPVRLHRSVVLDQSLANLHREKRVATLRALLDVIRNGSAQDVLTAGGFAIALEKNPVIALGCVDTTADAVDIIDDVSSTTLRSRLISWLEELVSVGLRDVRH